VGDTADPLVRLIQQFPIAAAFLLGFSAWLVAFEEELRRLIGQRRSTGMRKQLDELRRDIRRLEAQRQNLLVRFLNSERSSSSSAVAPDETNPSMIATDEIELIPESPEIAAHEKTGFETNSKIRSTRAMMYYDPSHGSAGLFIFLLFGALVIGVWAIIFTGGGSNKGDCIVAASVPHQPPMQLTRFETPCAYNRGVAEFAPGEFLKDFK